MGGGVKIVAVARPWNIGVRIHGRPVAFLDLANAGSLVVLTLSIAQLRAGTLLFNICLVRVTKHPRPRSESPESARSVASAAPSFDGVVMGLSYPPRRESTQAREPLPAMQCAHPPTVGTTTIARITSDTYGASAGSLPVGIAAELGTDAGIGQCPGTNPPLSRAPTDARDST